MFPSYSPTNEISSSRLSWLTNIAVFLLGAIALVVPSGYSIGAVILLTAGLGLLVSARVPALLKQDALVISVLIAYATVAIAEVWWDGQGSRGLDRPIRFILAIPALLWILWLPPRLAFVWSGFATGAIAAGSWAFWQKFVEGAWRAGGFTHVIQFGNLSMLLGILCLAGLGWAMVQRHRSVWLSFLLFGALAGILGSLLSGSRGGWVGFPVVLWVLYRSYGRNIAAWIKILVAFVIVIGIFTVYALPQVGVQYRVHQAINEVSGYLSDQDSSTSVGARFEMWRGAANLIQEKPLFGWGENGYQKRMAELAQENVINSNVLEYRHAHNEFIDTFAKRGVVGLVALLLLYLVPMRLFGEYLGHANLEVRSIALAGVLLPIAYIDFGLTQAFLAHNSGVMMYAFLLAVVWGIHSVHRRQEEQLGHNRP
ncbi:O-antigen ligase family protein [Halomonas sp. SpR8]|uniref:O-antigen ligase family protein n=1 Tax=Halomonas sp. SpR8 TaxID=3050463 RepID=UPI0027E4156A|nr:O-antigen ligase family protein [Halomonas sp. SpR8]MDQ7727267.1 O-antigen ligase family protein [Halomonas sp. SpR8]